MFSGGGTTPRRERLTILLDLLQELERTAGPEPKSLSQVASRCNIPFDRFQALVADLQRRGLVESVRPFRPTADGSELLRRYRSWLEALSHARLSGGAHIS